MKTGDIIELKITDMLDDGRGFGKHGTFAVFITGGGVYGDLVSVELTKIKKSFAEGRFKKLIQASDDRIKGGCPYADKCGGCSFQNVNYEAQIELKKKHVLSKLERIAGICNPTFDEVIVADELKYYRNKATFAVGKNGEVGFYMGKSHKVIDVKDCLLQNDYAVECADVLRCFIREYDIPCIKQMTVKYAKANEELMVIVESDSKEIPHIEILAEKLDEATNCALKSLYILYNKKYFLIAGVPTIVDELTRFDDRTLSFEISPQSFYQVNTLQMQRLYNKAFEYSNLTGKETVYDLYCGIGTIGLFVADKAARVIGVESVKQAVLDANRNAVINGIVNAVYYTGQAEKILPDILSKQRDETNGIESETESVIVLDPPRAGCDEALLETILEISSNKIVYISCDAATLSRDLKFLTANGYKFEKISLVDQFVWTNHVECVVLLSKHS